MIPEFQGKYRFLSNFWPCKVVYEGLSYPSSEHAYQAAKSPKGSRTRVHISELPGDHAGARQAKREGRKATYYSKAKWDSIKVGIMYEIVWDKFTRNKDLGKMLTATGTEELQEGNRWGDDFWGISPAESGFGHNHLGKILMKIRKELRK